MRVSFSVDLKPKSGKQNFAIQLAEAFRRKGIKVTDKKPNINLVFVKGARKGCKNILRLDGAWMNNKMNYKGKNKKIASVMKQCDGVIYQSKYSKKVCEKFIGKHKKMAIIHNGCHPDMFLEKHKHKKPYILACSRWRPHKRLSVIIEGFLSSGISNNYDLIICGEVNEAHVKHPSIVYMGRKNTKDVYKSTAGCEFVVHLAYLDCCPNSVIESLVAGKNVLFARSGGTPDIVGESGVGIYEEQYQFKAIDLYKPPKLSMDSIIAGYQHLAKNHIDINRQDLHIDTVADKYIHYIKTL